MLSMSIKHPDIYRFIESKSDTTKITGANISVKVTDDFMEAVLNDGMWNLEFPDVTCPEYNELWTWDKMGGILKKWKEAGLPTVVYETIKARELWDLIMQHTYDYAEPGILFEDTINDFNNLNYCEYILSSNPCQPGFATVLTPEGIRTFDDIDVGSIIWSQDGFVEVINKIPTGVKKVYRYNTTSGEFIGTPNHRIVSKGEKVEVENAICIDSLRGPKCENTEFIPQLVMNGLVLGDGMYHKASNKVVLCIGEKDTDYHTSEIAHLIKEHRPDIKSYAWEVTTDYKTLERVFDRYIPDEIVYGDPVKIKSFLRGLYSANGSVVRDRVVLKSTSYELIRQVRLMLSSIGIKSYYTTNEAKTVGFDNGDYTCKESYDLNISTDSTTFYHEIGFIQKYKMDKLSLVLRDSGDKTSFDIKDIDYLGEYEVFDITVNGVSHTYWTGGVNVSNCGEQPLVHFSSCNLAPINLAAFVTDAFKNPIFEILELKKAVKILVRAMDNMLDINYLPLPLQVKEVQDKRPIGIGIMGLGSALAMLKIPYNSEEAIGFVRRVMQTIRDTAYRESIELAKEKGPFPMFNLKFLESKFAKGLPADIREGIKEHGIRNSRLISIAPTGTTSFMYNYVTGGIEPMFQLEYERTVKEDEGTRKEIVRDFAWDLYVSMYGEGVTPPDYFVTTDELTVEDHLNIQQEAQKYVDSAISKTVNIPKDYSFEDFKDVYLEAWTRNLKGVATYRENPKRPGILTKVNTEKPAEAVHNTHLYPIEMEMSGKRAGITYDMRGKNGEKFYATVNIDSETGSPRELFLVLPKEIGGKEDEFRQENFNERFSDLNFIARLVSLCLRCNIPVERIINMADKSKFNMFNFAAQISNILKDFLEEDTVSGTPCPHCGEKLIKESGCEYCSSCDYSKCNG